MLGFLATSLMYMNLTKSRSLLNAAMSGSPGIVGMRWLGAGKWYDPLRYAKGLLLPGGKPRTDILAINPEGRLGTMLTRGFAGMAERFPSPWTRGMATVTGAPIGGGLRFGAFTGQGMMSAESALAVRTSLSKMNYKQLLKMTEGDAGKLLMRTDPARLTVAGAKGLAPSLTSSAKMAGRLRVVGGVATPLNYLMWGWLFGSLAYGVGRGVGAVAGAVQTSAERVVGQIRSLEFGGGMAPAFQTRLAITERQRAIQEIGRHSLNARSLMGQEGRHMQDIY